MDNTSLWKMLAIALAERVGAALAALLVADGLLTQADVASFERIFGGLLVGVVVMLITWYREKGHLIVENELKIANQRIAAMKKAPPIVAK